MAFFNDYKAPILTVIPEPAPGPYNINFNHPFPSKLETDKIRLVPFLPSVHSKAFYATYSQHPELGTYLPVPWTSYPAMLTSFEPFFRANPQNLPLAIIDKTKLPPLQSESEPESSESEDHRISANLDRCLAGMIGFVNSDPLFLSIEIGPVIILPNWHRTFVSSHAIGLLMGYALNLPEEGGLGLRRVQWTCYPDNAPSLKTAARMGFKVEGTKRWFWVLPEGKEGNDVGERRGAGKGVDRREGKPVDGKRGDEMGADNMCHAVCWDDWEGGVKDLVQGQIDREA
ncbi:acyl-CoA N-acyltransferase [Coprinopsis marcescibilis]|uniref:Acyl-CoA N-acyltransferase n=1 Tax=Coprinopsis marcescibilis TaxID=230819 RepID=A0A5C3L7U0_COPMA|nr:acyl-CoA N-acyltransferase [Coprinopsis marcescibilis]